jgi:hypothetical protein
MRRSSRRRSGISLAEVLIAIFVMGIGLLGILSLFPLAALNMAQAIKDENSAQLNQSATAMARAWWKEETPYPPVLYPNPPSPYRYDPLFNVMSDVNFPPNPDYAPDAVFPPAYQSAIPALQPPTVVAGYSGPSYPVYVDPVGWHNGYNAGAQKYWLAGNDPNLLTGAPGAYLSIPRRSLRRIEYLQNPPGSYLYTALNPFWSTLTNRYCYRLDDIGFGKDGTPYNSSGDLLQTSGLLGTPLAGEIQRDGRYSCGYMLKRPSNNLVSEADLTVVVYSGRSIDGPSEESAFQQTVFVQGSTEAVITYAGAKPKIRKGTWILDATMVRPNGAVLIPEPHGNFYRVISVNDDTPGQLFLELQAPARQGTVLPTGQAYGVAIVMDGVVEVFERGTLTRFTMPVP